MCACVCVCLCVSACTCVCVHVCVCVVVFLFFYLNIFRAFAPRTQGSSRGLTYTWSFAIYSKILNTIQKKTKTKKHTHKDYKRKEKERKKTKSGVCVCVCVCACEVFLPVMSFNAEWTDTVSSPGNCPPNVFSLQRPWLAHTTRYMVFCLILLSSEQPIRGGGECKSPLPSLDQVFSITASLLHSWISRYHLWLMDVVAKLSELHTKTIFTKGFHQAENTHQDFGHSNVIHIEWCFLRQNSN